MTKRQKYLLECINDLCRTFVANMDVDPNAPFLRHLQSRWYCVHEELRKEFEKQKGIPPCCET